MTALTVHSKTEHVNEELTNMIDTGANAATSVITVASGVDLLQKHEKTMFGSSDFIGDVVMEGILLKYLPKSYQFYKGDQFILKPDETSIHNIFYRRLLHTASPWYTWGDKTDYNTHNIIEMAIIILVDSIVLNGDRIYIGGSYEHIADPNDSDDWTRTKSWQLSHANNANLMVHHDDTTREAVIIPIDNGWGSYLIHRQPSHMYEINEILSQLHNNFFKFPHEFAEKLAADKPYWVPRNLDHSKINEYAKIMSAFWRQFGEDVCADIFAFTNNAILDIETKYSDAPWYMHNNHEIRKKLKWMHGIIHQNIKNCRDLKIKSKPPTTHTDVAFQMANPSIPSQPFHANAPVDYYNDYYHRYRKRSPDNKQSNVNYLDSNNYYPSVFLLLFQLDLLLVFIVILCLIMLAICIGFGVHLLIQKKQPKKSKNTNSSLIHESV